MEGLKTGWYKSKKGWASALLAAGYFILDHVSRAETARHIYNFFLSTGFAKVSPWIAPVLFVLALVFFEIERRKSKRLPLIAETSKEIVVPLSIPGLVIQYAGYGLGGDTYQDVTATLKAHVQGDKLSVPVSNSTFNSDPFPGKVKHVVVNYSFGEIKGRILKKEGEQLRLPAPRHILRLKVVALGRDLFAFLRERETEQSYNRVEAIHYGYERRFQTRVRDLFGELSENNVSTEVTYSDINPQIGRATTVQKIAQECFLIAARMDIEDEAPLAAAV